MMTRTLCCRTKRVSIGTNQAAMFIYFCSLKIFWGSQWRPNTRSRVIMFQNAKEPDERLSRCRHKPIAFATHCIICRGIVQKKSSFSWVCEVYGSIRGMQRLSLQILPRPLSLRRTGRRGVTDRGANVRVVIVGVVKS